MTSRDVLGFYRTISEMGVEVWIDGGWGVDAVLVKQTGHKDLDIAIQERDVAVLREVPEARSGNGREKVSSNQILEQLFRLVQRREELLQPGAVFDGRDEGRFFVTLARNPEKVFR